MKQRAEDTGPLQRSEKRKEERSAGHSPGKPVRALLGVRVSWAACRHPVCRDRGWGTGNGFGDTEGELTWSRVSPGAT